MRRCIITPGGLNAEHSSSDDTIQAGNILQRVTVICGNIKRNTEIYKLQAAVSHVYMNKL